MCDVKDEGVELGGYRKLSSQPQEVSLPEGSGRGGHREKREGGHREGFEGFLFNRYQLSVSRSVGESSQTDTKQMNMNTCD